jgi:hypothetical protein
MTVGNWSTLFSIQRCFQQAFKLCRGSATVVLYESSFIRLWNFIKPTIAPLLLLVPDFLPPWGERCWWLPIPPWCVKDYRAKPNSPLCPLRTPRIYSDKFWKQGPLVPRQRILSTVMPPKVVWQQGSLATTIVPLRLTPSAIVGWVHTPSGLARVS